MPRRLSGEARGDLEGAIAVLRPDAESASYKQIALAVRLATLLSRHDRGDEETPVLRRLAETWRQDWLVDLLCTRYAERGRPEDGLAYLDDLKESRGEEEWEIFRCRIPLLVACGQREEALRQIRDHPEGDSWYAAGTIAELLAEEGLIAEAVTVLQRHDDDRSVQAWYLIDLGRVQDAITIVREPAG